MSLLGPPKPSQPSPKRNGERDFRVEPDILPPKMNPLCYIFGIMSRTLAILLALGVALPGCPCAANDRPSPSHTARPNNEKQVDAFTYAKDCCRTEARPDDTSREKPLPRFARPEWVIVYITAVYVVITGITFWAIWRQGQLIGDSVMVAKRQADLMENAERARITVVVSRFGSYSFVFNARNIGKTSAKVTYARGFCTSLDQGQSLPLAPVYLSSEVSGVEPVQWVGAGADLELVEQKRDGEVGPILIADLSQTATRNNIQFHGCSMWIYGRICYHDGISPVERESRFCYGFLVESRDGNTLFYAGGPPAYRLDT